MTVDHVIGLVLLSLPVLGVVRHELRDHRDLFTLRRHEAERAALRRIR